MPGHNAITPREPLLVVFSYAREDEQLRDRLEAHLRPLERIGVLRCWHDRDILAGQSWREEIEAHLLQADVILLLISPAFLDSDYCSLIETVGALERHASGTALVIPVLLRPVGLEAQPWAHLQGVPRDLKAVSLWQDPDEALATVAREVLESVEAWRPLPISARSSPLAGGKVEERVLDAAIPGRVEVGATMEALAQIRLPESEGLRAILRADPTYRATAEDVRSSPFEAEFPRDLGGRKLPLVASIVIESPDFAPPRQIKRVRIPPETDAAPCVFLAVPKRAGSLSLEFELLLGDLSVASQLVRTHGERAVPAPELVPYVLASLPLMTVSFDPRRAIDDSPVSPTIATTLPPALRPESTGAMPVPAEILSIPQRPRAAPARVAPWVFGGALSSAAAVALIAVVLAHWAVRSPVWTKSSGRSPTPDVFDTPVPTSRPNPPTPVPTVRIWHPPISPSATRTPVALATPLPSRADESGVLTITVTPWAEVTVDGESRGRTPLAPLRLTPGAHRVVLTHPEFQPLRRTVRIEVGKPVRLEIDLVSEGVRR